MGEIVRGCEKNREASGRGREAWSQTEGEEEEQSEDGQSDTGRRAEREE